MRSVDQDCRECTVTHFEDDPSRQLEHVAKHSLYSDYILKQSNKIALTSALTPTPFFLDRLKDTQPHLFQVYASHWPVIPIIQCVRFYSDEVKRMPFQKFFEYLKKNNIVKKLHSVQFFLQKTIMLVLILNVL